MPISSTVYRQAATAVQRTLSSKSPSLRTAASTPPHPRHWVQLARPTKDYTPRFDPAAPPVPRLSTLVLPKPPFQELRDLATFAYVKAAPLPPARGAGEAAERPGVSAGRKRGRVSPSFAGREQFGSRLLGTSIQTLLKEKQQDMSAEDLERLQHALLGNTCLSFLSRHYKLPSLLPAETLASPSITSDPAVQAALFRAYVAGLWEQEGEAYTRQWLRQCFRSFINNDYAGLRKTIAEQEAKKLWPMNAPSPDTPLNRFNALVKVRKFEVEWKIWAKGVPPRQAFKAEVRFNGATLTGGGRTARTAQQDAAAKALEHISKPQLFENRKNVVWRSRLLVYCLKHRLTTKFDTQETEKNSYVFSSRLKIDGHQWEATGLTKEHARSNVSKLALETLAPMLFERYKAADEKQPPNEELDFPEAREAALAEYAQLMEEERVASLVDRFPDEDPTAFYWAIRLHNFCSKRYKNKLETKLTRLAGGGFKCEYTIGDEHKHEGEGSSEKLARASAARSAFHELTPELATIYEVEDANRKAFLNPSTSEPPAVPHTVPEVIGPAPPIWPTRLREFSLFRYGRPPLYVVTDLDDVRRQATVDLPGQSFQGEVAAGGTFARANAARVAMRALAPSIAADIEMTVRLEAAAAEQASQGKEEDWVDETTEKSAIVDEPLAPRRWTTRLENYCYARGFARPKAAIQLFDKDFWLADLTVAGQSFKGQAMGKKFARADAARAALRALEPELAKRYEAEDARLLEEKASSTDKPLTQEQMNALHLQRQFAAEQPLQRSSTPSTTPTHTNKRSFRIRR